ncbi:hypothetical protein VS85_01747 [Vibrio cholerae]|nr:hypothetical protein VS84_01845 [Vibrio cholerae]KKP12317.1 hypothetical protein VS85_01747 [Vibrio cholerae]KKP20161.1 hypothetical protein VS86_02031 [Vibrio cholerae]
MGDAIELIACRADQGIEPVKRDFSEGVFCAYGMQAEPNKHQDIGGRAH